MENCTVYSLPVSGGSFVCQSACLIELYEAKKKLHGGKFKSYKQYKPDICLASSGGNVTTWLSIAGDFTTNGILRMVCKLEDSMFVKSWFPDSLFFIPTVALGVFKGSLFRAGYGPKCLLDRYYSPKTLSNTEVWIGTHNQTFNKAEFFCNKKREDALIKQEFFAADTELHDIMNLRYLGDEEDYTIKLAKACSASASIPYIVEPQIIDGNVYTDGGSSFSSPCFPLIGEIYRLVKGHTYENSFIMTSNGEVSEKKLELKPRRLRHFYFSPYDTYSKEMVIAARLINGPIAQILHSNLLQDKAAAILNLQRIYGIESNQLTHEHYVDANSDILCDVLRKLENYDHFVLDLYPKGASKIPLKGFTTEDILCKIREVRKRFAIQVSYYKG
jgi:hypothetical protein